MVKMIKTLLFLTLLCFTVHSIHVGLNCENYDDKDSCFSECDCCWVESDSKCHNTYDKIDHCHTSNDCDVMTYGIIVFLSILACFCCVLLIGCVILAIVGIFYKLYRLKNKDTITSTDETLYGSNEY